MSYLSLDLEPQVRGDTWVLVFLMQDANGAALDITGNQYWFTLKVNKTDTDPAAAIQIGPVSPTDAVNGEVTITVPSGSTATLDPATYYYDVQEVTQTNEVKTLALGKIRIRTDITLTATHTGSIIEVVSYSGKALYRGETTAIGTVEIFLDGVTNNRLSVAVGSVVAFDALVVGRDSVTGDSCAYKLVGAIKNIAGTTSILGTVGRSLLGEDDAVFDATITADDTNDSLKLEVVSSTVNETEWAATLEYTEVQL
jgi:hypothetical protein